MEYINKKELTQVVFVTGATRSGKIILSRILSGLDNTENIRYDPLIEQFPCLHRLNKIDDDTCKFLLNYSIWQLVYNNYIGRNINFKPNDFTSIWNTPNPKSFFNRLIDNHQSYGDGKMGDDAINSIMKSKPIFHMMIHFQMMHIGILFKSFPRAKIYSLIKNPIDLVFSWMKKGLGDEFYKDPRQSGMLFKYKNYTIPYYAVGWEDLFITLNDTDKIIFMINHMNDISKIEYNNLDKRYKKNLRLINFDNLVENPQKTVDQLCGDLDTNETFYIKKIYEEESFPRKIDQKLREIKLKEIKKTASKMGMEVIDKMMKNSIT